MSTTVVHVDADYCDACPSDAHVQASVYIEMPSHLTLSMCGHHHRENREVLIAQGATVIDFSDHH